jgi:hypothetical protein
MSTKVKVRVVVEVEMTSGWGKDCTLGQMCDQAQDEALRRVQNALRNTFGLRVTEAAVTDVNTAFKGAP